MARSKARESFTGKRTDRRYLKAKPLPDLDDFLLTTPDHYRLITSETGLTTRSVLCDCSQTTDHC